MKKLLRFADIIILICATIGMVLQLWIFLGGPDEKGLYSTTHPGWIISWVLSGAVLVFVWLVTRQVGNNHSYKANFPASIPGAIGCLAAAVAIGFTGWQRLADSMLWLDTLSGLLGLLSAIGLLVAAFCRLQGKQPPFICYMLPCAFLALHVFFLGRELGGEPEMIRYLFRFLAVLSLIPACYQFWGFCVGAGERQACLFWCLLAGYLCILSAPVGEDGLLYLVMGIWMLTNPCTLKYLPHRSRPIVQPEPEAEIQPEAVPVQPEIPMTMEETFLPTTAAETDTPAPTTDAPADEELDVDAIIAEILREIDSNVR